MIPRGFPPRRPRIRENVNEAIRAREVRAVFPDGTVEVLPTPQAIRKAQDLGLDLILIAPTAEPPVAKAMDYGQWQYENKKKQHEAKRKQHIIQVKELKFRPNTDDHDYDFKKNHAIRFLTEGNRVKAVVQFRGREIAHTDLGRKLLLRFAADLSQYGTMESPAAPGRPQCARSDQPGQGREASTHPKRKRSLSRTEAQPEAMARLLLRIRLTQPLAPAARRDSNSGPCAFPSVPATHLARARGGRSHFPEPRRSFHRDSPSSRRPTQIQRPAPHRAPPLVPAGGGVVA